MSRQNLKRRILIVGEGRETELNYMVGLRKAHEDILKALATSISVRRGYGGNAKQIVKNAVAESKNFEPDRRLGDRVFLLLDTEGAGRAPELPGAEALARQNMIEIVYSCPSFEYWLLCHFANITRSQLESCSKVEEHLAPKWSGVCKVAYDKADRDIFDRLAAQLPIAREQARKIDALHVQQVGSSVKTNPSTQVYELIAILLGVQTGEICPIDGEWTSVSDPSGKRTFSRGDKMPQHGDKDLHWRM